ncbi:LCP family protein [Scrofimicrobium sp. R131]|uniref:LCP family protein n=1 Tax=Scrofimicrobium appendicitidis TaxID=3079930 RepID=A0AAU7V844_9ACTO
MSTPPPAFPPAHGDQRRRPTRPGGEAAPPKAGTPPRRSILPDAQAEPPRAETPKPSAPPPPSYAPRRKPAAPPSVQPATRPPGAGPAQAWAPQPVATQPAPSRSTASPGYPGSGPARKRRRSHPWRALIVLVLLVVIAWPAWLVFWVNSNLHRVDALVPGGSETGTTYLLAGSDGRVEGDPGDIEGERSDSIMLIRKAPGGQTSMISLPRDTYVDIPGYGWNKINASFSFGGPQLLVETVQNLTGLHVDHYVQINMQGFGPLVDAVGGVNLCLDMDVNDELSGLNWTAGCHDVAGEEALAFARMRYSDPRGDLGRAERQRQVISAVTKKTFSPSMLINPAAQWRLAETGTETLSVDQKTGVIDIARLLLAFRSASRGDLSGTPPLASESEMTDVGSVVLLNEDLAPGFFEALRDGTLTAEDFATDF